MKSCSPRKRRKFNQLCADAPSNAPLSSRRDEASRGTHLPDAAQVRSDLDPMKYTLRTVPALLAKTRAWANYDKAAQPIKAAIAKISR